MDTVQEVLAFSRDYVNGNQTKERKQKIATAYKSLIGHNLRVGCGTCYIEAIFLIRKIMEKAICNYRLKPGVVLTAFGDASKTCTNVNLTDELAEYHLSHNPGCVKWFAVLPEKAIVKENKELTIIPVVKIPEPEKVPNKSQFARKETLVFTAEKIDPTLKKVRKPKK